MSFHKIIGHAVILNSFRKAIAGETLAHGYLFDGKGGVGKKLTAMALAKTVLCGQGIEACGICASCMQFDSANHPDFLMIEPDGASIKDKQMEEFQEFIAIKPYESEYKVVVINESDTMTVRAQNRILKLVEEPPGHSLILFIAENREALLSTVRSRLQGTTFNRLSENELLEGLKRLGHDSHEAVLAARFCDGSLGIAIKLLEGEAFNALRASAEGCLTAIHSGDVLKAMDALSGVSEDKVNTVYFLDLMIIWYRDALLASRVGGAAMVFSQDRLEALEAFGRTIDMRQIPFYIQAVEWAKMAIDANANVPLALEAMALKLTGGSV